MSEHFNQLSPSQLERLALLAEEMGEAIQMIGKVLRHGYGSRNPNDPAALSNRMLLCHEMGDVLHCLGRLTDAGDLITDVIEKGRADKGERVGRYLHHQP